MGIVHLILRSSKNLLQSTVKGQREALQRMMGVCNGSIKNIKVMAQNTNIMCLKVIFKAMERSLRSLQAKASQVHF